MPGGRIPIAREEVNNDAAGPSPYGMCFPSNFANAADFLTTDCTDYTDF